MKILLCLNNVENLFLKDRFISEGQEAKAICVNSEWGDFHNPLEAKSWEPDYVFFDDPGLGKLAAGFQEAGFSVFGGSVFHDCLAKDVEFSTSILRKGCKNYLPTFYADKTYEAAEWLISQDKSNKLFWRVDDSKRLYETQELLNHIKPNSVIQQAFPGSTQFSFVGFYNAYGFVAPGFLVKEEKGLFPLGGLPTPEGCTVRALPVNSPLGQSLFQPLATVLTAVGYIGPIRLDVVLSGAGDEAQVYVSKVSPTMPCGFWQSFIHGLTQDFSLLLQDAQEARKFFRFTPDVLSAMRVSVAPYPYKAEDFTLNSFSALDELVNYPVMKRDSTFQSPVLGFCVDQLSEKELISGARNSAVRAMVSNCLDSELVHGLQYKDNFGDAFIEEKILFHLMFKENQMEVTHNV